MTASSSCSPLSSYIMREHAYGADTEIKTVRLHLGIGQTAYACQELCYWKRTSPPEDDSPRFMSSRYTDLQDLSLEVQTTLDAI
jgi:hypothetical protein